jgi:hypothetical protein
MALGMFDGRRLNQKVQLMSSKTILWGSNLVPHELLSAAATFVHGQLQVLHVHVVHQRGGAVDHEQLAHLALQLRGPNGARLGSGGENAANERRGAGRSAENNFRNFVLYLLQITMFIWYLILKPSLYQSQFDYFIITNPFCCCC